MPLCASLSRSYIQQATGGKTQVASLISCSLLTIVLLWIGPFFETLPRCCLASIIIVSLKTLMWQVTHVAAAWKLSKLDALLWYVKQNFFSQKFFKVCLIRFSIFTG